MTADTPSRIRALHQWYTRNVMPWPLTPEVERRWFEFIKQGFNGHQFVQVVRYLRREISAGRRNPGAVTLPNILEFGEDGVLTRFVADLGLSQAQFRGRLEPPPSDDGTVAGPQQPARQPAAPPPQPASDEQRRQWAAELETVRRRITTSHE